MAIFASDTFTGGTGQTLDTYNPTFVQHSASAANAIIVGEIIRNTATGTGLYYYNATPPSVDYSASLDVIRNATLSSGKTASVAVRMAAAADTMYLGLFSSTSNTVSIVKRVSGSASVLGTAANVTLSAGVPYNIRLEAVNFDENTVRLTIYGNDEVLYTFDDTDANRIVDAGYAGLRFTGNSTSSTELHGDNFVAESDTDPFITSLDESIIIASGTGGTPLRDANLFEGVVITSDVPLTATVAISNTALADLTSLPSGWSGTGTYTCTSRSAAQLQTDLRALVIRGASNGTLTATLSVSDGSRSEEGVITVDVVTPDTAAPADLYPSASWDGTVTWVGRTVPVAPTRTTFKPIAHFAVPPYQDVTSDFAVPVAAYCKGGVASVTFWCEGNEFVVTEKSVITDFEGRDFEGYQCVLDASMFPQFNGPLDVYATVEPVDETAQSRVISLRLYRARATAVSTVKYVGPAGIDDTATGRGDTPENPYLTISHARDQINTAQSGDVGGGVVRLLAGTYSYGNATENFSRTAAHRWLTIEPASGVTRAEVVIGPAGTSSGLRTGKVHLKGVTIDHTAGGQINSVGGDEDYLWIDGCRCTGPGRTVDTLVWHSTSWTARYMTDTYITDYGNGPRGGTLLRNISIGTIGSDAFQYAKCILVSNIDEINKDGTVFHPDIWQMQGENNLMLSCKAGELADAQGIFLKDANVSDAAVVNCLFDYTTTYFTQARDVWDYDHILFYNNTWTGQLFFVDGDAARTDWDIQGNIFSSATAPVVADDFAYNHFIAGDVYGVNATSGAPDWDANLVPELSGNLYQGMSRLTIIDVNGTPRSETNAAIGALSSADEAPPADAEGVVTLRSALYQVNLGSDDHSRQVSLTDEHGVTHTYSAGDRFRGCESFDKFTTGEEPLLTKLQDALENELVSIEIPAAETISVVAGDKKWRLHNYSTFGVEVITPQATFTIPPSGKTLFMMSGDFQVRHEQAEVVTVSVYVVCR